MTRTYSLKTINYFQAQKNSLLKMGCRGDLTAEMSKLSKRHFSRLPRQSLTTVQPMKKMEGT